MRFAVSASREEGVQQLVEFAPESWARHEMVYDRIGIRRSVLHFICIVTIVDIGMVEAV